MQNNIVVNNFYQCTLVNELQKANCAANNSKFNYKVRQLYLVDMMEH